VTVTLGISLSAEKSHVVVLQKNKNGLICLAKKTVGLPFKNGDALPDILGHLQNLYQKKMRIIVGISSRDVMMHTLDLDARLCESEILQFLTLQSTTLFGHHSEALCFDYTTQPAAEKEKQSIQVIAARCAHIQKIRHAFLKARMKIQAIDVDTLALFRLKQYGALPFEIAAEDQVAIGLCLWEKWL
jgi:Tfp pilus assembly PilM family ATPase